MSTETLNLIGELNGLTNQLKETQARIDKGLADTVNQTREELKATKAELEALVKNNLKTVATRIEESEKKLTENVFAGKMSPLSFGDVVVGSDAFQAYKGGVNTRMKLNVQANTITGQAGSPPVNSDVLVEPDRLAGIVGGAFRQLSLLDAVPRGTTNSNAVEFTRELAYTNAAAETAEGVTKPEATLTFELATFNVATVAHWLKVSKQVLDDSQALESHISTRLRDGVLTRLNNQMFVGTGGQNISGMNLAANITAFTPVTGDNGIDSVNKAAALVSDADYQPDMIVMKASTYWGLARLKGAVENQYVLGSAHLAPRAELWGLPVVFNNAVPAGAFLVAPRSNYLLLMRQDAVVEMFEQDATNVQQNLVTVRAELRATLLNFRPASVRYGNLTL